MVEAGRPMNSALPACGRAAFWGRVAPLASGTVVPLALAAAVRRVGSAVALAARSEAPPAPAVMAQMVWAKEVRLALLDG
jgi:hypothetical protein